MDHCLRARACGQAGQSGSGGSGLAPAALGTKAGGALWQCDDAEAFSIVQIERAELGVADAHRIRQHGVEHRLKLAGRTGDDLQHLGGRGLLLQRFAQLVEQPRILDGDDRLVGEVA